MSTKVSRPRDPDNVYKILARIDMLDGELHERIFSAEKGALRYSRASCSGEVQHIVDDLVAFCEARKTAEHFAAELDMPLLRGTFLHISGAESNEALEVTLRREWDGPAGTFWGMQVGNDIRTAVTGALIALDEAMQKGVSVTL